MRIDKRLLSQAAAAHVYLGLTIAAGLLVGAVLVGQARLLSRVVSRVFLGGASLEGVWPLLLLLLILSLARAGLSWLKDVAASRVAARVKTDLRRRLSSHLLALGPVYEYGQRSGELANTVVEGIEALDAYVSQYLPQLALAALVPLTILLFVFPLDFLSGLVLLLTAPLIPVFMFLIGDLAEALTRRQWTALSRMSAHFLDVLQGLTTLKLLGRSRDQIQTITRISDRFRQTTLGVLRVAFLSALVMEMVATISTAVVAVQMGLRLLTGHVGFEEAFFVLILAPEFYLPLRALGARHHAAMSGLAAAGRIFEVLGTEIEDQPAPATVCGPGESGIRDQGVGSREQGSGLELNFHLHLRDVFYTYPDRERATLKGLSFEIAPGQKVALVGPSGSGKTTAVYLLLRFIEPDQGSITVDGIPLQRVPPQVWRAQVAWVPQTPYLFHTTVAENIRLARPDATRDEVVRAARQAYAHDFIQALPQGYDTLVGERGARLSGGQAQRIALARAFLKDAPLLILDEPTSNLDPEHEACLQAGLARLVEGRTVLTIAHRLSTVYQADQILVVADGQVVESGTHTTLLEQGELYPKLVSAYVEIGKLVNWEIGPTGFLWDKLVNWETGGLGDWRIRDEDQAFNPPIHQSTNLPMYQSPNLPTFLRLLKLAAPFAGWMALAVLLGFATIGSGIGLMATSAFIIARAAQQPSIADLQVAIVGVRFFGIARGVFRYLERYISHEVNFRLLARLRVWFYQAIEPLAPARLMRYRGGDILSRIVADVETLEHMYVRVIAPPLVALLAAALMGVFTRAYDPGLARVTLGFLALGGVGLPLLIQRLSRAPGRRLVSLRSDLNAALVDGVQGVAELLAFNQEERHQERVEALNRELVGGQKRMAWIEGLHGALTGLFANLAMLAALLVAIPLVTRGRLDGVDLAVLALAVLSAFEAIYPLPLAAQYLEKSLEAARRLFEIVDSEPAVRDPESPSPLPRDYGLSFESLRFSYAPGEPPALDGISLVLPQGGSLAVVGPSGAGKSSLVNLLLRFWDYQEGQILLGGHDLRAYRQEDLRRMIAVVSQHTHLFNASIRENLLLARPDADQADLVRAARLAHLDEFIESLPEGYDTWIGEQGLQLSGGQRQRLAIARAVLKDAPILILDEPTANLDALTGREVMRSLQGLMAGRTTLIITHRLVGLEAVDEILVLRAGRVVERGSHHDLVQSEGLYRRMWELQNQLLVEPATLKPKSPIRWGVASMPARHAGPGRRASRPGSPPAARG